MPVTGPSRVIHAQSAYKGEGVGRGAGQGTAQASKTEAYSEAGEGDESL